MQHLTPHLSYAERRRMAAVGANGIRLGLDQVPGVVLAVFTTDEPRAWMPEGHHFAEVWTTGAPTEVWRAIKGAPEASVMTVVPRVHRANRWPWSWARWRAWVRWQLHRLAGGR